MTEAERQAARAFFIVYRGARPAKTSHRQRAALYLWCAALDAFLNPEFGREEIDAARRAGRQDDLDRRESAERIAEELRQLYRQTLETGKLPADWRAYSTRPGTRQAGRQFETHLSGLLRPPDAEQHALF